MARIFIAGPYTQGDPVENTRRAVFVGRTLIEAGHAPYVPHLTHLWHLIDQQPYEVWIALHLAFLPTCEAVLRLPGESPGADGEVARARELGLPVYYSVESLLDGMGHG